ncbi:Gustatory receptor 51, partial [Hyalella azteca]
MKVAMKATNYETIRMMIMKKSFISQKTMFVWLLGYLRLLGHAPYVYVDGKYRRSQIYHALSVLWKVISSAQTLVTILAIPKFSSSEFFDSLSRYWDPAMCLVYVIFSWHFLLSSSQFVRLVRNLNRFNNSNSPSVDLVTLLIIGVEWIALGHAIESKIREVKANLLNLLPAINFCAFYIMNFNLALLLSTIMKLFTSQLKNIADSQLISIFTKDNESSHPSAYQERNILGSKSGGSAMWKSTPDSPMGENSPHSKNYLDQVRKNLISCNQTVRLIHSQFSVVGFGLLAAVQIHLVMLALHAMYHESNASFWTTFLFVAPAAGKLWLIVDSQTGFVKECEEGVHRVKIHIAEVGRSGPKNAEKVWQLRGIQAELMPRFTILGLFKLGRHCLLS